MPWHTLASGPDIYLIVDDATILGSIALLDREWQVEVLWSGPGGDIKAGFQYYTCAVSFVQGVEAMFDRTRAKT